MRRLLGALSLCLLLFSAGCMALGPGSVDEAALEEDVDHEWNTTANVTVTLEKNRYLAVYHLSSESEIELYHPRRLNNREPIDPIGLTFRYENGTVLNLSAEHVRRENSATVLTPPASNGSVGFAANRQGKTLRMPRTQNGSYEVILPPGGRVEYPLLGRVIPGGYETDTDADGLVHILWESPERNQIAVEYYLTRDFLILSGLVGLGAIAILIASIHYLLTIRTLRRRREAVDVGPDDPDGP